MERVTMEVQVVTCAVDIIAERGQQLLVLGDTCIGVRTAEGAAAPPARTTNGRWPTDDELVRAVVQGGPVSSRKVGDRLGYAGDDKQHRSYVGYHLRKLAAEGRLVERGGEGTRYTFSLPVARRS